MLVAWPNWEPLTAWTAAYTVLTGLIAIGAFATWKAQSTAARSASDAAAAALDHAEIARKSSIRPVLVVSKTTLVTEPQGTNPFVEVRLRNVGAGPALNVRVNGLAAAMPDTMTFARGEVDRFVEETAASLPDAADLAVEVVAIAVDETVNVYLMRDRVPRFAELTSRRAIVWVRAAYDDLDGTTRLYPESGFIWRPAKRDLRVPDLLK